MAPLNEVSSSQTPEEYLRLALEAKTPDERARFAAMGLDTAEDVEPDTEWLLLRQVYLAHVAAHRFRTAADVAEQMAGLGGPLKDVAHHDGSRALAAIGDTSGAIAEQRMAARSAPPARRSFQGWALGTLLQFDGDHVGAASALRRAERWASEDRPLIRAHRAWVELEAGEAAAGLDEVLADLEGSPARKGYGELVLGMLRYQLGDLRQAAGHLRTFLRRNASADAAKVATLREELRRARTVLAEIESV